MFGHISHSSIFQNVHKIGEALSSFKCLTVDKKARHLETWYNEYEIK